MQIRWQEPFCLYTHHGKCVRADYFYGWNHETALCRPGTYSSVYSYGISCSGTHICTGNCFRHAQKTKYIKHPWFDRFKDWYGNVLGTCLRFKPVVFIAAVVLLVGSGALCMSRGMTFMDMDMESNQISLTIEAKDDEKLDFKQLTELSDKVMDKISDIKGIDTIGATAGGSSTMNLMSSGSDSVSMYILLDEKSDVSSDKVIDEIENSQRIWTVR